MASACKVTTHLTAAGVEQTVSAMNLKPLNPHMHTNHYNVVVGLWIEPGQAKNDKGSNTSGSFITDLPGVIAVGYKEPADPAGRAGGAM